MIDLLKISDDFRKIAVWEMIQAGYKAQIMEAERLVGDHLFSLPSGRPMPVLPIECLPGCPESWVRESGTYVIPVEINKGIWFSWIMNDINTAVVLSVKGMNPITGRKIEKLNMEQYRDKCPEHDINLGHDGFCEKCGFKIPSQNYVSYPNKLWWDGFRQADGSVRQFFFTEDDKRDIASLVMGKINTVPAFGFGFFRTKQDRVVQQNHTMRSYSPNLSASGVWFNDTADSLLNINDGYQNYNINTMNVLYSSSCTSYNTSDVNTTGSTGCHGPTGSKGVSGKSGGYFNDDVKMCKKLNLSTRSVPSASAALKAACNHNDHMLSEPSAPVVAMASAGFPTDEQGSTMNFMQQATQPKPKPASILKDVSVGAGARIDQKLDIDKTPLTEYLTEPQGIIRLYFVFEDELRAIVDRGGIKEYINDSAGYLKNLPVG